LGKIDSEAKAAVPALAQAIKAEATEDAEFV
jgi:hypothetical protein